MITALDATALIYAMDKTARRSDEQKVCESVHEYIEWLKESQRDEIQIPAPAFSEFLAFYSKGDQTVHFAQIMAKGFRITPTDMKAAALAAEIWNNLGSKTDRRRIQIEADISKQCIKTDILIVATSLAHGAGRIVTSDSGIIAMAKKSGLEAVDTKDCTKPSLPERYGKSLTDFINDPDNPTTEE